MRENFYFFDFWSLKLFFRRFCVDPLIIPGYFQRGVVLELNFGGGEFKTDEKIILETKNKKK